MTSPAPLPGQDPIQRANWLGRYLGVERKFDESLKTVLVDALSGIDDAFGNLGGKFSDRVRRAQLSQSNRAVRGIIHGLWGDTGNLVREYRQDAAVAAVDAGLYDQRSILARIFPDSASRTAYADSLRQTGRRNIESVITRVIETEKPLSARVYKSEALANGLVSTTVNRALARGDSAANLARDVKALIDPNVPGGVSYAAKRLGRTEINNAFHAQSIHDAQQSPWIQQMRWYLSKVHVTDPGDECEDYAQIGLFPIESVPEKPHPNCRCYVTPELPEYQNFENALVAGQYDSYLDSVLGFDHTDELAAKVRATKKVAEKAAPPFQYKEIVEDPEIPLLTDIKNAKTHAEVTAALQTRYPHLKFAGWNKTNVSLEGAKETAEAITRNMDNIPGNGLTHIAFQKSENPESAKALAVAQRQNDGTTHILMNPYWSSDPSKFAQSLRVSKANGHNAGWNSERPLFSTFTHEFGHVIDNDGHKQASTAAPAQILEVYARDIEPEPFSRIEKNKWEARAKHWVVGDSREPFNGHAPSGYSVEDTQSGKKLDPNESVAESYLDVFLNGDNAKPTSKELDGLLFHHFLTYNREKFDKGW